MNFRTYTFLSASLIAFLAVFIMQAYSQSIQTSLIDTAQTLSDIKKNHEAVWKDIPLEKRKGWKQYKRWAYLWERRIREDEKFPDYLMIEKDIKDYNRALKNQNRIQAVKWSPVGPFKNPESGRKEYGVGRINVVRFHPKNEGIIWVGSASGGCWYTTTGGDSWTEVPFSEFLSLGVSDIAISESDPEVIYVGTGDTDGSTSIGPHIYAVGVVKSTDGGQTWKITNLAHQLADQVTIGRVLIHPGNPDIVLATTNKGIYKTTDGGLTWKNKVGGLFYDMEAKPSSFLTLYASTYNGRGGTSLFRTTDEGETWNVVRDMQDVRRSAIAVTPAAPNNVYVITVGVNSHFENFLFSSNSGETWDVNSDKNNSPKIIGMGNMTRDDDREYAQGWYDLCIGVHPKEANRVIVGGINLWQSTDNGESWYILTDWYYGSKPKIHADQHDVVFSKSGSWLAAAHDGGLDISSNKGVSWNNCNDGLSITQFYRLSVYQGSDIDFVLGGTQDNGTSRIYGTEWENVWSSDGMECLIDPTNKDRYIVSTYNGYFYKTENGGGNFSSFINPWKTEQEGAWVTPLVMDPVDKAIFYAGYNDLFRTTDNGQTWSKLTNFGDQSPLIYSIAVSPANTDYIFYATANTIFMSEDNGESFKKIYSADQVITYLAAHPDDPKKLYISLGGFNKYNKVMLYDNGKIVNLTGNLPNVPVNAIVYQEDSPDRIYAGTDIGVFYEDNNNGFWIKLGTDLPNVFVHDLEIKKGEFMLYAATYGRGIWKAPLITCSPLTTEVIAEGDLEFCKGDSVVLRAAKTGDEIIWSDGRKGESIVVKESGSYSFAINPSSDCPQKSNLITVNVKPATDMSISGYTGEKACEGDTITLTAKIGFKKYLWSTGETERRIRVANSGNYYCIGTSANECISISDTFSFTFLPKPQKPYVRINDDHLEPDIEASSYQWYRNGEPIEGAKDKEFHYSDAGNYQVEISNDHGCKVLSDIFAITGAEENNAAEISIYPNPNNGKFTLNIPANPNEKVEIIIYNLIGEQVYKSLEYNSNNIYVKEILMTNVPKGIYSIKISIGNSLIYKSISLMK